MNRIMYVGEHPKIYNVRMHKHQHWEVVYCTAGQGTFRFESQPPITYSVGDAVVIPPQMAHANYGEGGFSNIYIMLESPPSPTRTPSGSAIWKAAWPTPLPRCGCTICRTASATSWC